MTNATVAAGSDGQTLKLDYKGGGTQTIKVKPGTSAAYRAVCSANYVRSGS